MKRFNAENGILHIRKKDVIGLPADMPREALRSFNHYLAEQLRLDIRYLAEKLTVTFRMNVTIGNVRVERPPAALPADLKREPSKSIKIIADIRTTFANDEAVTASDVVLFHLPFMEEDGVFSNGSAIVSRLSAAEEMTYDDKNQQLTIALPIRKINFLITGRDVLMCGSGSKKISLFHALIAMASGQLSITDYATVIPKGTVIDDAIIKRIERNRIQKLYVKCLPFIAGSIFAKDYTISTIPKGAKVTQEVLGIVPELEGYTYVPEDINVDVTFYAGEKIKTMSQRRVWCTRLCSVCRLIHHRRRVPVDIFHAYRFATGIFSISLCDCLQIVRCCHIVRDKPLDNLYQQNLLLLRQTVNHAYQLISNR